MPSSRFGGSFYGQGEVVAVAVAFCIVVDGAVLQWQCTNTIHKLAKPSIWGVNPQK